MQALLPDPGKIEQFLREKNLFFSLYITFQVMAITEVSPGNQYAVAPFSECFDDENRIDPAGAHDAYGPDVGWVLQSGYTRKISTCICAPVTKKCYDFGFEVSHVFTFLDVDNFHLSFLTVPLKIP
jgi:hypothetical protein